MGIKTQPLVLATVLLASSVAASVRVAEVDDLDTCFDGSSPTVALAPDGLAAAVGLCVGETMRVVVHTSGDVGLTWSGPTDLGTAYGHYAVAASRGGIIDVVWHRAPSQLTRSRSTDGGSTWSSSVDIAGVYGPSFAWFGAEAGGGDRLALSWSSRGVEVLVTTDLESWSHHSWPDGFAPSVTWLDDASLVVCWTNLLTSGETVCARSTDGGVSFDAPIAVAPPTSMFVLPDVVSRGLQDIFVTTASATALQMAHSTDGGVSWSDPRDVTTGYAPLSSLALGGGGVLWVRAVVDSAMVLYRSDDDGVTWTERPMPDASCDQLSANQTSFTALDDGSVVSVMRRSFRGPTPSPLQQEFRTGPEVVQSTDGGASWRQWTSLVPRAPIQDTQVVRTTGGRLVALWAQGVVGETELVSSHSDDDGFDWSAPAHVSDVFYAPAQDSLGAAGGPYNPTNVTPLPAISTITSLDGGVSVLWLSRNPDSCLEVRLSRSADGQSWEPSIALGETTELSGSPISLAEDGLGRQVAIWRDGLSLMASRSLDGGTWSDAFEVAPWDGLGCSLTASSNLVRAADGSLVFLGAVLDCGDDNFALFRTASAGFAWEQKPFARSPPFIFGGEFIMPVLVSAGDRLFASILVLPCLLGPMPCVLDERVNIETYDLGDSWLDVPLDLSADRIVGGDADGNVYFSEITLETRTLRAVDRNGLEFEVAAVLPPTGDMVPGCLIEQPLTPRIFHADWETGPTTGVFFTSLDADGLVLRDDSLTTLVPRPDFATIFPLPPYMRGFSGMHEPEDLIGDDARPLVLYQIDDPGAVPRLAEATDGKLVLTW